MANCKDCKADCCKHVAIEIDKPENKKSFENIKWYVAHKNIHVWVNDEDEWHVEFATPCEHLRDDYSCKIYTTRPNICREYDSSDCVANNLESEETFSFNTIEDVEKYVNKNF